VGAAALAAWPSGFLQERVTMSRKLEGIRNIGVIAHIDAGKTTVTERMLFYSGASHRVGQVDKGTTETDFDEEEQQRGITIYSACVTFPWRDTTINLIDTPGHVDFTAEVERCLRVLDGGVVVFSAREGVEAQSETVWRQANRYGVPRIAFINKLDREGADFRKTIGEIESRLGAHPVAIQIPVGQGPPHVAEGFRAIIDLISMKMLVFAPSGSEESPVEHEIPEENRAEAQQSRMEMLEVLYDFSDELVELALQEMEIPSDLVRRVLHEATIHLQIQPVLCGSALDGIGVQPLLDAVNDFLPHPGERPAVEGENPRHGNSKETRKPSSDEPFAGLVFKIVADRHGDMSWVRVYSGRLKSNTRILNATNGKKENAAQLWHMHAARREQVPEVDTGDIVGIIGLKNSVTGDTVCDTKHPIVLESISFPETVISMAIEPESTTERKKLSQSLDMMRRQDPTFQAIESEDTGQTIISGMGELHLEVIKHRLLRDFGLNVKVHKPRVSYRESVRAPVNVVGECQRQIGGQNLFAGIQLRIEPCEDSGKGVVVENQCSAEAAPAAFIEVAMEELSVLSQGGGSLGGFPLMNTKVTLLAVDVQEEITTEVAIRIAAGAAFEKGLSEAGPVLLEPIMKLVITTPETYLGDFVGDLQQRRATISQTTANSENTIIEANAPLATLFGYSSSMRSLSKGRASCSMEPMEYGPAPPEVAKSFAL